MLTTNIRRTCVGGDYRRVVELFVVALLLHALPGSAVQSGDSIVILPFADHSHFPGTWKIRQAIPEHLGELLGQRQDFVVIPVDSAFSLLPEDGRHAAITEDQARGIGQALGADLVMTGDILNFSIQRVSVGNPFVAGYSSYTALVEVETRLLHTVPGSQGSVVEVAGRSEATSTDLGLTLLGRPTETRATHTGLNDVPFGGEEFRATIIGKVTFEALAQIAEQLRGRSRAVRLSQHDPKVLSLEGEEGFVNLGVEDEIEVGYKFVVYSKRDTQRVGLVQIVAVLAPHLSQIRTLEGEQSIVSGDLLRDPSSP